MKLKADANFDVRAATLVKYVDKGGQRIDRYLLARARELYRIESSRVFRIGR